MKAREILRVSEFTRDACLRLARCTGQSTNQTDLTADGKSILSLLYSSLTLSSYLFLVPPVTGEYEY